MSETPSEARTSPKKGRSPSYPAIDLEAAIRRADTLFQHEKMHAAPITAIVRHWGYKTHKSGIASVQYAALKKFGLLAEEGSGDNRRGQLTPLAYAILRNPDETERDAAVRHAALTPPIHRELWEAFGQDLPSDANLRYRLVTERGFTEAGADDFVKEYKATMAFAMKDGSPGTLDGGADTPEPEPEPTDFALQPEPLPTEQPSLIEMSGSWRPKVTRMGPINTDGQARVRFVRPPQPKVVGTRIPIPLVDGQQIIIEGEFPITEAAWANFQAVLAAFRPGLVKPDPGPTPVQAPTPAEFLRSNAFAEEEDDDDGFEPPF